MQVAVSYSLVTDRNLANCKCANTPVAFRHFNCLTGTGLTVVRELILFIEFGKPEYLTIDR
jgi:hypothetical protein